MGRKNKRLLEVYSFEEKVSPPSKMAKSTNAKVDEILLKLTNLEKEVSEIKEFLNEIKSLKKEVEVLKETCNGFQRMEIESKKRSVLVKGLRFKTQEKYETRSQTKAALVEFFDRIEMTPHLVDYQRLGGRRDGEDGAKVSVRIQFMDVDQKLSLFDKLKLKGRELQDISIQTDYPSFQVPEFKRLSEEGYKIRTDVPGTRTRVVPRGTGLILQRRASPNDRWSSVSA